MSSTGDDLRRLWDSTDAAADFTVLPAGKYNCRIVKGELFTGRTNRTPGYKLTLRVLEGEYANRQLWHDIWLTQAAMPMAKRDLSKLGITSLDHLDHPLPPRMRCTVYVVLRRDDDGREYNRVRSFDVIGVDPADRDTFAPNEAEGSTTPF